MLKYKKIYIESLKRISGTPSNFIVELPETVQLDGNTKCQIHEITIPHSWYGISTGYNDNFYFYQNDTVNTIEDYRQLTLRQGSYTSDQLATEIEFWLNTQYDVNGRTNTYSVSYLSKENQINIVCNYPSILFSVFTDSQVITEQGNFTGLDTSNLNAVNDIINYRTFSGTHSDQLSWFSGFVDLQPIKNLYLTCNDLCNYNQLTLDGYSGIVKKIPVVSAFTGIIFDNEVSIMDYIDCSNKVLRKLNFKIEDERGRQVPLNNVDVSFSLTFFKD